MQKRRRPLFDLAAAQSQPAALEPKTEQTSAAAADPHNSQQMEVDSSAKPRRDESRFESPHDPCEPSDAASDWDIIPGVLEALSADDDPSLSLHQVTHVYLTPGEAQTFSVNPLEPGHPSKCPDHSPNTSIAAPHWTETKGGAR